MYFQIVIKKSFALTLALFVASVSFQASANAQGKGATPAKSPAAAATAAASPLGMLPRSDFVAFVNVRRLINDAAPKALAGSPEKLAEFNAGIDKFKTQTGIDPRSFESLALGMRYQHPRPGVTTTDTVVIANGNFNAGALLAAARLVAQGKYTEEKYNGATVYLFNIQDHVKMLGLLDMKVSQVAAAALDSNTLALGEPASVREALDARSGRTRPNADLVQLASRTPNAIMGFGANVPPALIASADFGNDEMTRIVGTIRQAYGAVSTTQSGFGLLTVARTEKAEDARTLSDTLSALKQFGGMMVTRLPEDTGKLAQNALDSLQISAEGNEAAIRLEIQLSDFPALMRVLQPKPKAAAAP